MTVQNRLSRQTIAILVAGIFFSVVASYNAELLTARFGAEGWLASSLTGGISAANGSMLEALSAEAHELAQTPELQRGADPATATALISRAFGRPHRFWAVLDDAGAVGGASHPGCQQTVRDLVPSNAPQAFTCAGVSVLAIRAPVPGLHWRGLMVGVILDGHYADHFSRLFNTEVAFLVDDRSVATSLRDEDGRRIPLATRLAAPSSSPTFGEFSLFLRGYHGFVMGNRPMTIDPNARWYVSTMRLSEGSRAAVALLVPVKYMIIGARYAAMITSAVALVLIALIAMLVWKIVGRFTRPIRSLSASAKAVADGDLTIRVPVPDDAQMGDFCQTYNQMLDSMQALMATQKTLARAAGMSEIATGVLHNVGNVLNSVNVSASLALECAERLKLESLSRVAAAFEGQGDELGRFLTEDARGRKMPAFLRQLAGQLTAERQRLRDELRLLVECVESVKGIIATQQQFARAGALVDRCSLGSLVDEAVRLEATALQRHEIELTREVPDDVSLIVDRYKLIHILVNLLSNAKQALSSVGTGLRRIRVRAATVEGGMLRLSVEDSGAGIAHENLQKIFGYGFTTKPDGHGFGLHQSAISATEMGGSLAVASEGPGLGAVFTLVIPLVAP